MADFRPPEDTRRLFNALFVAAGLAIVVFIVMMLRSPQGARRLRAPAAQPLQVAPYPTPLLDPDQPNAPPASD